MSTSPDTGSRPFPEPSLLLPAKEVARLLSVSGSMAYALMASGALPSVKIGRAIRCRRDSLAAYIEAQTIDNAV